MNYLSRLFSNPDDNSPEINKARESLSYTLDNFGIYIISEELVILFEMIDKDIQVGFSPVIQKNFLCL